MKKDNKKVKCDVKSCKYNDLKCDYCTLNEVKISSASIDKDLSKKDTICDSFEDKK